LGYTAVRVFSFLFRLIPISLGLWIGRRLGQLAYLLNARRRAVAYRNLRAAFGPEMSRRDINRIIRRMYQNLMQTLVEVLTFPRLSKGYAEKYVSLEGTENIERAAETGRGMIFLTGHFGNWELLGVNAALKGYPMLVLAREQKHSRLNDLLNSYREITGCRVVKKGFALREMITALRNNSIIGMLVDQDAGKRGVFVDFFGRKTSTAHGPMSFALKTGAAILPVFIERRRGPYHRVYVERPLEIEKTRDVQADIANGLQKFAAILESYVRRRPDQWLWIHKRWKSTPTKKILILSDGKAGHLNQSVAVAEAIQRNRGQAGYAAEDTSYEIADAAFRSRTVRTLFNLCAARFCVLCPQRMSCLRFYLKKNSYRTLETKYGDIIISCGASVEGLNAVLSRALGAKSIVIMKPSMTGARPFNLVIAPRHDGLAEGGNVVVTEGAPNRITEEGLKRDSSRLAEEFGLGGKAAIGVFVGGDSPEFRITEENARHLAEAVCGAASDIDGSIMVTTSRRTSAAVERVLKERFGREKRCKLLVIANEKNVEGVVSGMLGLCRVSIVSGESISMVSEAAAAPNYTFVFKPEKRKKKVSKHEFFLENLNEGGYIRLTELGRIRSSIKEVWGAGPPANRLNDGARISEALKKII